MEEPLTSHVPSAPSYGSSSTISSPSDTIATNGDTSCEDSIPGCKFDPTIIPDTQIFCPPRCLPMGPPSTVEAIRGEGGVYSNDQILDHDAEELWRFLTSNLNPPRVAIRLFGSHTETRTRTLTSTVGGTTTIRTEDYTLSVTDFDFRVDVSNYVLPQGFRIVTLSRDRLGEPASVRDTLEEYTSSRNVFKELRLEKHVVWDYDRVVQLLADLVRSSTRHGVHVKVGFPKQDSRVSVFASNGYSRAWHSTLVQVLCVLTCLWIVFLPAWAVVRKRMKNRLSCEFDMAVSADEFYHKNCCKIRSAVLRESKGEVLVAL